MRKTANFPWGSGVFLHNLYNEPIPTIVGTNANRHHTRVEWKVKIFEFKKVVLIYGPKYLMTYFYLNFEFLHPLVVVQFDWTS